jgi:hypothetical protein
MFRSPMTLDRRNRMLTALVGGLLLITTGVVLAATRAAFGASALGCLAVVGALLALAWAMSPTALVVDAGEVRIERRAWPALRLPLASVASASPLDRLGAGLVRVFGAGGFFGSYGLFYSRSLGRFRLYATRTGPSLILKRNDGAIPLVVTPDDVAGAIDAIGRRPHRVA